MDSMVVHHSTTLNGTRLHHVSAGDHGSPILLVHGFPETWWAFHAVVPLLAEHHRVHAVDLRGFGDSQVPDSAPDSATVAEDLHQLVAHLGEGPVHLLAQDVSGGAAFRLATAHPEDLLSLTAVEMGLAGFGLEAFADVAHGGVWHIGALATPGIPELLFPGHEAELLATFGFDAETVAALAPSYARPGGWRGASGLYRSMLAEGEELRELARRTPLTLPLLAVDATGAGFTAATLEQVAAGEVERVQLDGVGHYAALEAPAAVASALSDFTARVDAF
jgi:pimeloyl-ACP methyl ester carboxylesterase